MLSIHGPFNYALQSSCLGQLGVQVEKRGRSGDLWNRKEGEVLFSIMGAQTFYLPVETQPKTLPLLSPRFVSNLWVVDYF